MKTSVKKYRQSTPVIGTFRRGSSRDCIAISRLDFERLGNYRDHDMLCRHYGAGGRGR